MIFNMVGGGGGSGATLVVSSPANVSVTVSKDDKSYTKNSGSLGSATFKGLATGTWTVTISGNGQTATKTIVITADYAITIAFFSASINITYPATSTCVVTDSSGTTVASDTNTGSSTKTWTATVGATGTYTVTATATDGSGKSKSQSVSITADGQSESVTLMYALVLFDNGAQVPWTAYNEDGKPNSVVIGEESIKFNAVKGYKSAATTNFHDMTPYKTAHLIGDVKQVYETDSNNIPRFMVTNKVYDPTNFGLAHKTFSSKGPVSIDLDISNITGSHKIEIFGTFYGTITQVWLTED